MVQLSTAYYLLRPFFRPVRNNPQEASFFAADNWTLDPDQNSALHGALPSYTQELNSVFNPHLQLTKSLAAEWSRHGIRVNSISPGYMDTALNRVPALDAQKRIWIDQTPQKRLGNVDDLNNLAVYLASDGSGFMTGNNCLIDGGYSVW